jgi:tetratricopeptide (TPR) repeat protein
LLERARKIDEAGTETESVEISTRLNNLAMLYSDLGKQSAAEETMRQALAMRQKAGASTAPVAESMSNLGIILEGERRYGEAESLLQQSLNIRMKILPADDPILATDLSNLATVCSQKGNWRWRSRC